MCIRDRLKGEEAELSRFVLEAMLDNYEAAEQDRRAMCADTGVPRFFVKAGNEAQIEGGFVQGQGWLTIEELNWKSNGQITTFSPSTYKIPAVSDMPEKFNVEIFKDGKNKENVVNKSKTTGEPPLMLGMSVFFAIKDAISSIANHKIIPNLNAPATSEAILLSINDIKNKI